MSHWRGGRIVRTFWAAASRDVMARLLRSKLGPIAITFFFFLALLGPVCVCSGRVPPPQARGFGLGFIVLHQWGLGLCQGL